LLVVEVAAELKKLQPAQAAAQADTEHRYRAKHQEAALILNQLLL
jgi:hypothetical protein